MNRARIWISIACLILAQTLNIGCGNLPADYSAQIANAQKSVPFKIIIPTYLPPDMRKYPISISPPDKGALSKDSTLIAIIFARENSANRILIYEENSLASQNPRNPEFIYLDIGGIKVLEEKTSSASAFSNNMSGMIDTYHYAWNQNDTYITADISGSTKAESRKVIGSMIQP